MNIVQLHDDNYSRRSLGKSLATIYFPSLKANSRVIRFLFALEIYSKYLLIFGAYETTEMNTFWPYLEHSFARFNKLCGAIYFKSECDDMGVIKLRKD